MIRRCIKGLLHELVSFLKHIYLSVWIENYNNEPEKFIGHINFFGTIAALYNISSATSNLVSIVISTRFHQESAPHIYKMEICPSGILFIVMKELHSRL